MSRYRDQVVKEVRDCKSACKTMGQPYRPKMPPSSSTVDDAGAGRMQWCHAMRGVADCHNDPGHKSLACKRSKSATASTVTRLQKSSSASPPAVSTANNGLVLPLRMPPNNASQPIRQINQLCRAGLHPIYIHKPTFGKIPGYLQQRIRAMASEEERQRKEEIRNQILCQYVPSGERTAVLEVYYNAPQTLLLYASYIMANGS